MAERYSRDTVVLTTAEINELVANKALDPTVEYWVDRNKFAYAPTKETMEYLVSGDGNPVSLEDSQTLNFDIVVYGATPAGILAAVAAVKNGSKVLLISPNGRIGGIETAGLSRKDYIGLNPDTALNKLSKAQATREAAYYGISLAEYAFSGTAPMSCEPKVSESLYRDLLKDNAVQILYGWRIKSVVKPRISIESILLEKSTNTSKTKFVVGQVYLDMSYESDLMMRSGVTYTWGREASTLYSETLAGVRTAQNSPALTIEPSPYIVDGNSGSGLLPFIDPAALETQGTADARIQAFSHRLMMTNDPANRLPNIPEPVNYVPAWYELHGRAMAANPTLFQTLNKIFLSGVIPAFPTKSDFNNNGTGLSSDFIGGNAGFVVAPGALDYASRQAIVEMHYDYTLGLFKFLRTDPRVPPALLSAVNAWGFCKDEFVNDTYEGVVGSSYAAMLRGSGMSPELYIRESARMVGDFVMNQNHTNKLIAIADPIAYGSYSTDSHFCSRRNVGGVCRPEGGMSVDVNGLFPIDYRVMLPKSYECSNLLVGCNGMSVSHVAYNSMRLEYTYKSMGEAAGWAASMSLRTGQKLHDISGASVKKYVMDFDISSANLVNVSRIAKMTGSISGTAMTITGTPSAIIAVGDIVAGTGVSASTTITALGTGTGGAGTYVVTPTQTVSNTSTLTATGVGKPANATIVTVGTWNYGKKDTHDYFGDSYATDNGGTGKPVASQKISPTPANFPAGKYRVRVNLIINGSSQVSCRALVHANGIDYQFYPKCAKGRPFFADLGVFQFAGDGSDYVTIDNQGEPGVTGSGSGLFAIEAVHFEPTV